MKDAKINAMNANVGVKALILAKNAKQINILILANQQENHNFL